MSKALRLKHVSILLCQYSNLAALFTATQYV